MFSVGLTLVALPLVGRLQFPLQDFVVVGLSLVMHVPCNDSHRLVRRFDGSGVPIVGCLLSCSNNDDPSIELVRSDYCRRIAHCRGVAFEGIDQILLVAELVYGFRDFGSRFVDESTKLLDFSILSRHRCRWVHWDGNIKCNANMQQYTVWVEFSD